MFSMLLPLDANAARHAEQHQLLENGSWSELLHDCWSKVLAILGSNRR